MSWQDNFNACLEMANIVVACLGIKQLMHDRDIKGIHWSQIILWTIMSIWFCYYYFHLGQYVSFAIQLVFAACSLTWDAIALWLLGRELFERD